MEIFRFCIFLFVYFFSYNKIVSGFSCDYAECTCMDDMITCVGVTAPRFKYRGTVTMLYMDNVQIVNLKELLKNLPNLRYLTLMNIRYFKCEWIRDMSEDIIVKTNLCESQESSTYPITVGNVSYPSEKTEIPNRISKIESTKPSAISPVTADDVSYQKGNKNPNTVSKIYSTKLSAIYSVTGDDVSHQKDIGKTEMPAITLSNSKIENQMENSKHVIPSVPKNTITSDEIEKNKKFWWIASGLSTLGLVVLLIILIICVYKRNCHRGIGRRVSEVEDSIAIPLSQYPEETDHENAQ